MMMMTWQAPQKDADVEKTTSLVPSLLLATSMRSGVANGPWKRTPKP
jgi:hypothetical protein